MVRRIIEIAAGAAVLALLLFAGGIQAPRSAQAAVPPPCPGGPGAPPAGAPPVTYNVFATLPAGPPAGGVCITLPGFGAIGGGAVVQPAGACPPWPAVVAVGAAFVPPSLLWADWGAPCVVGHQTIALQFQGPGGGPLGTQPPGSTVWDNFAVNGAVDTTVWPAACPAVPVFTGNTLYNALAPVPAGLDAPYDGVCINIAAGGTINAPVLIGNAGGCAVPALAPPPHANNPIVGPFYSAAVDGIWVDWTTKCAAGGVVSINFFAGPALPLGLCVGCATWLGSGDPGNVTITKVSVSVGGEAQAPDVAALAPRASTSPGTDYALYAGGAFGTVALVVLASAGVWYVRRRRRA